MPLLSEPHGTTSALYSIYVYPLIINTAEKIIRQSEIDFDEDEQQGLLDTLVRCIARNPAYEIERLAGHDLSRIEAIEFINSAIGSDNDGSGAELPMATSRHPFQESGSTQIESSELGRNQLFPVIEGQADSFETENSDWSLNGRHIESTIYTGKCVASLIQYGDHLAPTACVPRGAGVERTMLRTDPQQLSPDDVSDFGDKNLGLGAELPMATSRHRLQESGSTQIESSEIGRNQLFPDIEGQADSSETENSDWSLNGCHIESTIYTGKCVASLIQYGDHLAPTACVPRGAGVERTMLRTDPQQLSPDDDTDQVAAPDNINLGLGAELPMATNQHPVAVFSSYFFGIQVWYNPNPVAGQSYWSIKIRTGSIPDINGDEDDDVFDPHAMEQFDLHFRSSPLNFRKSLTEYAKSGKIDSDFDAYLRAATIDMNTSTKVALLSQPVRKKFVKVAKGKSSREIRFVDQVWASLRVDSAADKPVKLTIFHRDRKPIVITNPHGSSPGSAGEAVEV